MPGSIAGRIKIIMPTDKTIVDQMLDRQRRVFRIAQDPQRYGLTLKIIAADSKLGYDSIRNYASGDTQMPVGALFSLIGVLPDELLPLLLPNDRMIFRVPEGVDHDKVEQACRDYLKAKGDAHQAESPKGREISECEELRLGAKVVDLRAAVAV